MHTTSMTIQQVQVSVIHEEAVDQKWDCNAKQGFIRELHPKIYISIPACIADRLRLHAVL